MVEFIETFTILRRLFLPDVIPWAALLTDSAREKIRSRYKMEQLSEAPQQISPGTQPQFVGARGEFVVDGAALLVEQLAIEPTAVQFQINGKSAQADQFLEDLSGLFLEVSPERDFSKATELVTTYQTIATVRLSFTPEALFSSSLLDYFNETVVPRISIPEAEVDLKLLNLRWSVSYRPSTSDFAYFPKILAIEQRQGSRVSDKLYYTQSPSDFETHKELLEGLDRALSK